jgi:predicted transcriptional regulator
VKCGKTEPGSWKCTCGADLERDDKYDAMYCMKSHEWVESGCENCDNGYCDNRPEKYIHMSLKRIEAITQHILNALLTDGAHHKQYDLELALRDLHGEEWVAEKKKELASEDYYWEEGIPA